MSVAAEKIVASKASAMAIGKPSRISSKKRGQSARHTRSNRR
jgi:hypothetical protein